MSKTARLLSHNLIHVEIDEDGVAKIWAAPE